MVKFTKHLQGIMGIVQSIYRESWVMLRSINHVQMADHSSYFGYHDIAQNLYHFCLIAYKPYSYTIMILQANKNVFICCINASELYQVRCCIVSQRARNLN